MADIEERLRSHAQAFDGLLSLIPAKFYYGEDGSDQWKRKKQTKEQAREAKRAKLDPDSAKTAKDVMDEKARKRKRGEEEDNEDEGAESSDDSELGSEMPKEGLNRGDAASKKQKQNESSTNSEDAAKKPEEAEARRKLKEEKKAQKKQTQKEKKKAKDAAKKAKEDEKRVEETKTVTATSKAATSKPDEKHQPSNADDSDVEGEDATAEGLSIEFNEEDNSTSSAPNSPAFDTSNPQSGSSSISSIIPPSDATKSSSSEPKPLKSTPEELRQRLQKRLDELRAARQADGLNGKPARNRQELIEARRQKAEQRKAHKKLLRQKAKEEEENAKDEAMTRRFSPGGSGSLLASPRSPADSVGSGNYAFGRVVFSDGQIADPSLSELREKPKTHGPRDTASALKAAEAKKARLSGLDEEKRADIEEKDMWLNAKKRAHGERVRDDTSLLKKALKRKETAKKRSEREWKDRIDTVKRGKDMKQQKREENLRKRREDKGKSGGGKKGAASGGKKPRAGFEGSFKGKAGGAKKK
ncbi:surfeit locus protein 6-domain-containing protein [Aspergillus multicolor]|uniref:putative 60S ribosome biogenesis protein Rrp14 n=1 Tax=Aspergillus multicolor TaxID=41759 RepID=UPI003CCCC589